MAEITQFPGITKMDIPPDRVLEAAKGRLKTCLVIGYTDDGALWTASSTSDMESAFYMMEQTRARLLEMTPAHRREPE